LLALYSSQSLGYTASACGLALGKSQRKIMKIKDTTSKFVTMRLPIEIYEMIKAQAKAESRSVSGHIAYLLKKQLG
jgi:hypothetical protein